jgi:chemotaxis protein MotA
VSALGEPLQICFTGSKRIPMVQRYQIKFLSVSNTVLFRAINSAFEIVARATKNAASKVLCINRLQFFNLPYITAKFIPKFVLPSKVGTIIVLITCEEMVMDLATLIGLIGAVAAVVGTMLGQGGFEPYWNAPGAAIVFGGSLMCVLYSATLPNFIGHFKAMMTVFKVVKLDTSAAIIRLSELSAISRRSGLMALETQETPDPFFEKGKQLLVDGADEGKLKRILDAEVKSLQMRHQAMHKIIKVWIDVSPAMGMIGTLIGLVMMLGNMTDPKAIGPAMAVALLTTLYGALLANLIFGPMLSKMEYNSDLEVKYRQLIINGLRFIARGESPRNIQENLAANLSLKEQIALEAAV